MSNTRGVRCRCKACGKMGAGVYSYGFNGKENDSEVKGEGNQQDYGMRMYDPRLGRFLSVDPLTPKYPELTPCQFASNRPIDGVDLDGQEWDPIARARNEHPVLSGIIVGTHSAMKSTYDFFRRDAWKASTWKTAGAFAEEVLLDMSTVKIAETPMLDASVKAFKDEVVNGDAYSRAKWGAEFVTGMALGYLGDKGLSKLKLIGSTGLLGRAIANVDEVLTKAFNIREAGVKIDFLRDALGVKKNQNIALIEGEVAGVGVNDIAISGQDGVFGTVGSVNMQKRVFSTKIVGYDRLFDSEVKLLESFAETYSKTPNIEGVLKLTSERAFCKSCSGVIDQFKKNVSKDQNRSCKWNQVVVYECK